MKLILVIGMVLWMKPDSVIVDFSTEASLENWWIVDDVVMGGRSDGRMEVNEEGNVVFYGKVSLENNGGFSSVRHGFQERQVQGYHYFKIRLKGDGKKYQFRARSERSDRHAYAYTIQTDGTWQTVLVPMSEMYPTWRGMKLNIPNYPGSTLSEIVFLVGNKKNEEFRLEIDSVMLVNRQNRSR